MNPERWRRITEAFHGARQRDESSRVAFLDEACASDPELRAEVEALLTADRNAEERGDGPLFVLAQQAPLAPGALLGDYRIEGRIGTGGMGEVYRAHERSLGRDVALKMLPRDAAFDPARRERLLKEARSAAALNHPNICTIHGVGQSDDGDYIVFEYIEGHVLGSLRREGGLPLGDLLDLFLPLSEALDYAHRRGIVHRDLKPSNVMVTRLGPPKILDFGVAKLSDGRPTTLQTEDGVVMGTAGYMSPEQALGRSVDARTDVFAFGSVLYELATGRRAFPGASFVEVNDAVLHGEPEPLARLRPDLPRGLGAIVRRCLRKSPDDRYQEMSELARDLRALKEGRPIRQTARWLPGLEPSRAVVGGGGVLALALAAVVVGRMGLPARDPLPRLSHPVQITVAATVEDYPSWSPDGRNLAYESDQGGNWDVWLTQVEGGAPVNRTADYPGEDRYPSWSPDGRRIAFWSDREGGGYYVLPSLGGAPERVASTLAGPGPWYYSPPQWSADGSELAYVMYEPAGARFDSYVEIFSTLTYETRRLALPGRQECRLDLAWSRDGRYLAYVDSAWQLSETTELRVMRLSDGESVPVTGDRNNVRGPFWSADGRYLYFSANRVGASDLWRQRIVAGAPTGEPRQITTAVEMRHAALSSDGARIAFSKGRWVANVFRVPILEDRPATWADAEQMTFEQAYIEFIDVSRDGRRLLFSSDRAGNQDLWTMPVGGEMRRLTTDPSPDWAPRWSPDESTIAFYSSRTGDREIWTLPASGGAARRLTRTAGLDAGPAWSPDGRALVFRSERTGNSEIWTVASDGRDARQLTNDPAADYNATFSPDGLWLAFSSSRGGPIQLWRMKADGEAPELLSSRSASSPVWDPDGSRIYFGPAEGAPRFWSLSLEDGTERLVADLTGRHGSLGFQAPATDGTYLYFPWRSDVGDLWVLTVGTE